MRLSPNRKARSRDSEPGSALSLLPHTKKALYMNEAFQTLYSHKEPFYAAMAAEKREARMHTQTP